MKRKVIIGFEYALFLRALLFSLNLFRSCTIHCTSHYFSPQLHCLFNNLFILNLGVMMVTPLPSIDVNVNVDVNVDVDVDVNVDVDVDVNVDVDVDVDADIDTTEAPTIKKSKRRMCS